MYHLGTRSLQNLEGVNPKLVSVVNQAIRITSQDFSVIEGLRTEERQAQLVASGKSQTMNSRHLSGNAVDLAAWNGTIDWDEKYYYPIADAMIVSAKELNVPLRWGAAWHQLDVRECSLDARTLCKQYVARRIAEGRQPFLDFVHFEIPA